MNAAFPKDAPIRDVLKALGVLGFVEVRSGPHLSLQRQNSDGTRSLMTLPNHSTIKGSTLRTAIRQAGITRQEFLEALRDA